MTYKILCLSVFGGCLATATIAAPVDVFSEVDYTHAFEINSGSMPDGIVFSLAEVLERSSDASTDLDAPVTNVIDVPSGQVGELYTDPPTPYFDRRGIAETTPDNDHAARASYNVNILQVGGDSQAGLSIVSREVDNEGAAEVISTDGSVNGSGASDFSLRRVYGFENQGPGLVTFNIAGTFSAEVLAGFDGGAGTGFARSSLSYGLEIAPTDGVLVMHSATAPYLTDIEDSHQDAFVTELLDIGEDGFDFSASASVFGPGGPVDATYSGSFSYEFQFVMASGASFTLTDRFTQINAVDYIAPTTPVPLPASLPLLVVGICGLAGAARLRRKQA
ncbi:VPLPA-CTERM sorting domain-containing protein [Pseudooceanicola sp.]|uniref:VPLPA-CTERM sorting domain-containing protein n=1 Tax=Pseudooceanicola sp. TaxID=1914328 RepID=UPI0035C694E1